MKGDLRTKLREIKLNGNKVELIQKIELGDKDRFINGLKKDRIKLLAEIDEIDRILTQLGVV